MIKASTFLASILIASSIAAQFPNPKTTASKLDSLFELNNDSTSCYYNEFPKEVLDACMSISDSNTIQNLFSQNTEVNTYESVLVIYASGYVDGEEPAMPSIYYTIRDSVDMKKYYFYYPKYRANGQLKKRVKKYSGLANEIFEEDFNDHSNKGIFKADPCQSRDYHTRYIFSIYWRFDEGKVVEQDSFVYGYY